MFQCKFKKYVFIDVYAAQLKRFFLSFVELREDLHKILIMMFERSEVCVSLQMYFSDCRYNYRTLLRQSKQIESPHKKTTYIYKSK